MLCSRFVLDDISSVSDVKRKVSSAYCMTVQPFPTIFAKPLTLMLNNRGPKKVPCATPLYKFIQSDLIPFMTTLCVLSLKQFSIKLVAYSSKLFF